MSKGLEALNILYEYLRDEYDCRGMEKINECKDAVEKELKALDIIKDHGVDVAEIMICQDYARYEEWFRENVKGRIKLNNKEFSLLREVLS